MGLSKGKTYHLSDGFIAVYRHTSYDEIKNRLEAMGFNNFSRMVGGFPTDFDHDVIALDKYGKEKYGDGDIRFVCQKCNDNA